MHFTQPEMMARRTLGFAAIGAVPRESLVRASLQLLDEAQADVPAARKALLQLASGMLPSQTACLDGHREMRDALAFRQDMDEADAEAPVPRG